MNTSQYMDKQIMDLVSQGSTPTTTTTQTKDFIDLINHHHPEEEEKDDRHSHHGDEDGIKREEIVPSYDFQPLRPITAPAVSNSVSGLSYEGGSARAWMSGSLDSKLNANSSPIRNYSSLDTLESTKVVMEKDRHGIDTSMASEIDRTMKKHVDNVLHALEGVSARLTQLESRTRNLENSVDDLKVTVGNNHGSADGKMRQLENILIEVQTGVQILKDKQEIMEGQLQLAKLHISKSDQHQESQKAPAVDPVQQPTSAPQQSLQQPPPPPGTYQPPPPTMPIPNTLPPPQQNLPPPVPIPNQFSQNQITPVPPREPYYPSPAQAQEASTQQYQLPPAQQPQHPPAAPPHQQYPPPPQQLYSQPTHPPQQRPSTPPVNPPQIQPPVGHHPEETSYGPPQTYSPNLHLPTSQPPAGPPPSQQLFGPPSQMYEPPLSRASSGYSAGYGHPSGPGDSYPYGGPPPQYASSSPRKSQQLPQSGGSGYPQLPTARVLPQALPTASSISSGSGSAGSGNRVPVDDVVDKVTSMGFPRDQVRATVRRLTENGQAVDLNIVLDKLMNDSDVQPPRGWFGR